MSKSLVESLLKKRVSQLREINKIWVDICMIDVALYSEGFDISKLPVVTLAPAVKGHAAPESI